jgi:uncharacterized transporter YbjL
MGRLLAFIVIAVAMAFALGAFTVLVIAFASGDTDIVGSLVGLITASFGVASVGEIIKNWSKKIEVQEAAARYPTKEKTQV